MARVLERHPGVHLTVNFVPSLTEQIEALLAGEKDDVERVAEKHADTLDEEDRRLILSRCFSVRWNCSIEPRPRYAQLYARRTTRFSVPELRDVQCLFLLAWLGFAAREGDPAIDALEAKGQGYSEDDKAALLAATRRAAGAVLPAWRNLAERGQVEISTSPYFHPILPLLIDSNVARRPRPGETLPPRFVHPEDARLQTLAAKEAHQRFFGRPAAGMWPPEGSLSPEAVRLYADHGVRWLAGDEATLARSLEGEPNAPAPARARNQAWRFADVDLVFRNHELSDRIGFRYAEMATDEAVTDLVTGLRSAGGNGGVVGIFLDGENAWEGYPKHGAEFLDRLYGALESETKAGRLRARTVSEAISDHGPGKPLSRLHSGSWIDGNFRIWIGDPEKNRAWSRLAQARDRLATVEASRGDSDPGVREARRHILCCEGSDWFWWFGDPFSSQEDRVFDELFRANLQAAWRALGDEPPEELSEPISEEKLTRHAAVPTSFIRPHLDGVADRYFEWLGAARTQIGRGSMMADRTHPIEYVHVGFDDTNLYVRLDPVRSERRRVAASRMLLRLKNGDHGAFLRVQLGSPDGGADFKAAGGRVAALDVVELALPFSIVQAKARDELRLWLTLEFAGIPFARVPRDGLITVTVPWPGWEDEHWSV